MGSQGSSLRYSALGYRFRVETPVEEVGHLLTDYLAPFAIAEGPGRSGPRPAYAMTRDEDGQYAAMRQGSTLARDRHPARPFDTLLWWISHDALQEAQEAHLCLHAGAVSRRGRGVLLPGTSGAGKSTLVAALTAAGFDYLSDEVGAIDPVSAVLRPFPRPLWLKEPSIDLLGDLRSRIPPVLADRSRDVCHIRPTDLRPGSVGQDSRVGLIVFPTYSEGGTTLQPVSKAAAVVDLIHNAFNFARFGGEGLRILTELMGGARAYRMTSAQLGEAVDTIIGLVDW